MSIVKTFGCSMLVRVKISLQFGSATSANTYKHQLIRYPQSSLKIRTHAPTYKSRRLVAPISEKPKLEIYLRAQELIVDRLALLMAYFTSYHKKRMACGRRASCVPHYIALLFIRLRISFIKRVRHHRLETQPVMK